MRAPKVFKILGLILDGRKEEESSSSSSSFSSNELDDYLSILDSEESLSEDDDSSNESSALVSSLDNSKVFIQNYRKRSKETAAAEAAADALGRDLERMGYNLDCRSFITQGGSSIAMDDERYATWKNSDSNSEKSKLMASLCSSSDFLTQRSGSDVVKSLRSKSSVFLSPSEGTASSRLGSQSPNIKNTQNDEKRKSQSQGLSGGKVSVNTVNDELQFVNKANIAKSSTSSRTGPSASTIIGTRSERKPKNQFQKTSEDEESLDTTEGRIPVANNKKYAKKLLDISQQRIEIKDRLEEATIKQNLPKEAETVEGAKTRFGKMHHGQRASGQTKSKGGKWKSPKVTTTVDQMNKPASTPHATLDVSSLKSASRPQSQADPALSCQQQEEEKCQAVPKGLNPASSTSARLTLAKSTSTTTSTKLTSMVSASIKSTSAKLTSLSSTPAKSKSLKSTSSPIITNMTGSSTPSADFDNSVTGKGEDICLPASDIFFDAANLTKLTDDYSLLTLEEDEEEKAREKENAARQLILAISAESQLRQRRSLHAKLARAKLLQLSTERQQKMQQRETDSLHAVSLPTKPTEFMRNETDIRSAVSAPAEVELQMANFRFVKENQIADAVIPVKYEPTRKIDAVKINQDESEQEKVAQVVLPEGSTLSDDTPKIRGGLRIFSFRSRSVSPQKQTRQRSYKLQSDSDSSKSQQKQPSSTFDTSTETPQCVERTKVRSGDEKIVEEKAKDLSAQKNTTGRRIFSLRSRSISPQKRRQHNHPPHSHSSKRLQRRPALSLNKSSKTQSGNDKSVHEGWKDQLATKDTPFVKRRFSDGSPTSFVKTDYVSLIKNNQTNQITTTSLAATEPVTFVKMMPTTTGASAPGLNIDVPTTVSTALVSMPCSPSHCEDGRSGIEKAVVSSDSSKTGFRIFSFRSRSTSPQKRSRERRQQLRSDSDSSTRRQKRLLPPFSESPTAREEFIDRSTKNTTLVKHRFCSGSPYPYLRNFNGKSATTSQTNQTTTKTLAAMESGTLVDSEPTSSVASAPETPANAEPTTVYDTFANGEPCTVSTSLDSLPHEAGLIGNPGAVSRFDSSESGLKWGDDNDLYSRTESERFKSTTTSDTKKRVRFSLFKKKSKEVISSEQDVLVGEGDFPMISKKCSDEVGSSDSSVKMVLENSKLDPVLTFDFEQAGNENRTSEVGQSSTALSSAKINYVDFENETDEGFEIIALPKSAYTTVDNPLSPEIACSSQFGSSPSSSETTLNQSTSQLGLLLLVHRTDMKLDKIDEEDSQVEAGLISPTEAAKSGQNFRHAEKVLDKTESVEPNIGICDEEDFFVPPIPARAAQIVSELSVQNAENAELVEPAFEVVLRENAKLSPISLGPQISNESNEDSTKHVCKAMTNSYLESPMTVNTNSTVNATITSNVIPTAEKSVASGKSEASTLYELIDTWRFGSTNEVSRSKNEAALSVASKNLASIQRNNPSLFVDDTPCSIKPEPAVKGKIASNDWKTIPSAEVSYEPMESNATTSLKTSVDKPFLGSVKNKPRKTMKEALSTAIKDTEIKIQTGLSNLSLHKVAPSETNSTQTRVTPDSRFGKNCNGPKKASLRPSREAQSPSGWLHFFGHLSALRSPATTMPQSSPAPPSSSNLGIDTPMSRQTGPVLPTNLHGSAVPTRLLKAVPSDIRSSKSPEHHELAMDFLDAELKSHEEHSLPSKLDPVMNANEATNLSSQHFLVRNPPHQLDHKIPSHLILNSENYDDGSCLTSLQSSSIAKSIQRKKVGMGDAPTIAYDVADADAWDEIAGASLVIEKALKRVARSGFTEGTESVAGDDIEAALFLLKKHAQRLGVNESDLLIAVKSQDETLPDTACYAATGDEHKPGVKDDIDTVTEEDSLKTMTVGQEIVEAFKQYLNRK